MQPRGIDSPGQITGGHGEHAMAGHHMMKMWFHGGVDEVILFDWWRTDSCICTSIFNCPIHSTYLVNNLMHMLVGSAILVDFVLHMRPSLALELFAGNDVSDRRNLAPHNFSSNIDCMHSTKSASFHIDTLLVLGSTICQPSASLSIDVFHDVVVVMIVIVIILSAAHLVRHHLRDGRALRGRQVVPRLPPDEQGEGRTMWKGGRQWR